MLKVVVRGLFFQIAQLLLLHSEFPVVLNWVSVFSKFLRKLRKHRKFLRKLSLLIGEGSEAKMALKKLQE